MSARRAPAWQVWIDTGGTFTDCLARAPSGELRRAKVLSTGALRGRVAGGPPDPARGEGILLVRAPWSVPAGFLRGFSFRLLGTEHRELRVRDSRPGPAPASDPGRTTAAREGPGAPATVLTLEEAPSFPLPAGSAFEVRSPEPAPVLATRLVTGTPPGAPLPPLSLRLASTLATNALLERRGAPAALFVTRGFGDVLRIGTQQRPDLFALAVTRPAPLHAEVVEVAERIDVRGCVLSAVELDPLREPVERLRARGIESAAVALLHSWRNPVHERAVADFLRRHGFRHVSASAELATAIRHLPRAETAVVDACLAPVVGEHLERVRAALLDPAAEGFGADSLHVMTSAGGLVRADAFRPKDVLLSGPAGGVVGAAAAGRRAGVERLITLDMGGTSTDVARYDGDFEYRFEHEVGDAHLFAPALAIESVAAGGGSVCAFERDRLRVGPESAGADPGPACYGAGGPLTLTDVNLLLRRLDPGSFAVPLVPERAEAELEAVRESMVRRLGERPAPEALLEGFLEIANERMADAIRRVSLRRGHDPASHALVAFGGAGGQHACALARKLGIATVLVPADAGLLSALGLGDAVVERFAEQEVLRPLEEVEEEVPAWVEALAERALERLREEGPAAAEVEVRRRIARLRFSGQESSLAVELEPGVPLGRAFAAAHEALFGHRPERRAIELESLRVVASSRRAEAPEPSREVERSPAAAPPHPRPERRLRAYVEGEWREVPVYRRPHLEPGACLGGPALVFEAHGATLVEPAWRAHVDAGGALVLRRGVGESASGSQPVAAAGTTRPEAVRLELFTNRLRAIAAEMGERLRRTALSTNVKERLDFSCAILDGRGRLVVNAPHIPVHLGALGLCVRRLSRALPLAAGDVAVTNHPAFGGSHLPDVTVVTPVHGPSGRPLGYLATRAHHAEIGGSRPGSMPPFARSLAEEGVVLPPVEVVRGGRPLWDGLRRRLLEAPFPTRAVEENLADVRAAVAANHAGAEGLRALADAEGEEAIAGAMEAIQRRAARRLADALERLPDGRYEALERLDDGWPLRARLDVRGRRAALDFAGSGGVHPGNLNATPAIVRSVVVYVLRLLVREPLPLNEGLLRPIRLRIPAGILAPRFPADPRLAPAVAGGNVETSQRLVDTLLKALGLAACSQGTMNNVLFGNESFGYYETVGGGCGAGPGFDGASAVHSHMTNTRITDAEVLELRHPVRVERFAVRRGSGGAGRFRGGDGALRELTFLEPVSLSVVTQHRRERPYGLEGGDAGAPGAQRVVRASGEVVQLGPVDGCEVGAGDRLVLETPGGGGYGAQGDEVS